MPDRHRVLISSSFRARLVLLSADRLDVATVARRVEVGRTEQAKVEARDFLARAPGYALRNASANAGYSGDPEANRRFLLRLREAGLPDG